MCIAMRGMREGSQCTLYTNKSADTGEQSFETYYFMLKSIVVSGVPISWALIFLLLKSIGLLH